MEGLTLTDAEQKLYSELFGTCDVEHTGRVSGTRASELFLASQLPHDTLQQITELCGATRLGHFGRSQFYIALKLIAAVQNGLPVRLESLNTGAEIPLPRFLHVKGTEQDKKRMQFANPGVSHHMSMEADHYTSPDKPHHPILERQTTHPGVLPPPPSRGHVRSGSSGNPPHILHSRQHVVTEAVSNNLPLQATATSPQDSYNSSPYNVSPPTSSPPSQRRSSDRHHSGPAATAAATAKRSLFETRMDVQWTGPYEGAAQAAGANTSDGWVEFSSSPASQPRGMKPEHGGAPTDSEEEPDPWTITQEQRDYYTAQFKTMQPDLHGLIQGTTAREFFQRSKLPIAQLSRIWDMSDVNQDGALSLEEFFAAFHLVVARRNGYDLPETLPQALMPKSTQPTAEEDPFAGAPPMAGGGTPPVPAAAAQTPAAPQAAPQTAPQPAPQAPPQPVPQPAPQPTQRPAGAQGGSKSAEESWATFDENSSSPSPVVQSPANFDFAAVHPDPASKIIQPVPVRMSPEGQTYSDYRPRTFSEPIPTDVVNLRRERSGTSPSKHPKSGEATEFTPGKIAPPPPSTRSKSAKSSEEDMENGFPPHKKLTQTVSDSLRMRPRLAEKLSRPRSYSGTSVGVHHPTPLAISPLAQSDSPTESQSGGKKETPLLPPPPPRPPPRRQQTHSRSVSLDLNRVFLHRDSKGKHPAPQPLAPPPAVPPRHVSPATKGPKVGQQNSEQAMPISPTPKTTPNNVVNFITAEAAVPVEGLKHSRTMSLDSKAVPLATDTPPTPPPRPHDQTKSGAGDKAEDSPVEPPTKSVKKKAPTPPPVRPRNRHRSGEDSQKSELRQEEPSTNDRRRHVSAPATRVPPIPPPPVRRKKEEVQAAIRAHKERNTVLSRTNSELQGDLAEATEERVTLELQLQKLKPFGVTGL
ncbi:ralBP1-associated Eps domain-containing protein 1-like isoform X3 [Branchiostoma lanceolatum]|uniref:ralBP1-associated Eps domain-containing protein 1-like isoform X3 n=1 Tax=Branchiostoma lanceolatum TaxID=7740 RepID=UPI0034516516